MEKLTPQKVFNNLKNVYVEILTLEQDAKGIIDEAKDVLPEEVDVAAIAKLAKLAAKSKENDAIEKMKAFIELAEELS